MKPLPRSGLVMGYTVVSAEKIVAAVKRMKLILAQCLRSSAKLTTF
jgi:hypothetical protein